MLKIKTKDGQEINLSESDIREIIKESIEEVKKILETKVSMDSFYIKPLPFNFFTKLITWEAENNLNIDIDESLFIIAINMFLFKKYSYESSKINAYKISKFAIRNGLVSFDESISASVGDVLEFLDENKEHLSFNHDNGCPCITITRDKKNLGDFGWIADGSKIKPFLECNIERELLPSTIYAIIPHGTKTTEILNDYPTKKYVLSIEKPSTTNFVTFDASKNYLADRYYYSPEEKSLILFGGIHHRAIKNKEKIC